MQQQVVCTVDERSEHLVDKSCNSGATVHEYLVFMDYLITDDIAA